MLANFLKEKLTSALVCASLMGALITPDIAVSQTANVMKSLQVYNQIGGGLRSQIYAVRALRQTGQPVEILGDVCYSTCTLYLGLPQTCVSPKTVFGFHGPSSNGRPIDPQAFERASQLIVAHYPEVLHEWYMTVARHEISGLFKVTGAHLIRIGAARPCLTATR